MDVYCNPQDSQLSSFIIDKPGKLGNFFLLKIESNATQITIQIKVPKKEADPTLSTANDALAIHPGQLFCCVTLANQSIADGDIEEIEQYLRWNWLSSEIKKNNDFKPIEFTFKNLDNLSSYVVMIDFLATAEQSYKQIMNGFELTMSSNNGFSSE